MKFYRVRVRVEGLPEYVTVVRARSHKMAESLVPNLMGGKVSTTLLKVPK